jgi:hypothetical protein
MEDGVLRRRGPISLSTGEIGPADHTVEVLFDGQYEHSSEAREVRRDMERRGTT